MHTRILAITAAFCSCASANAQSCSVVWNLASGIGPGMRYGHAMAYDAARQRSVIFGGYGTPSLNVPQGDTWTWNGSVWTQRANTGPGARAWHAMAYDSARARVVLFGGSNTFDPPNATPDPVTWEWDGTMWTSVPATGPSPRYDHSMAYDSVRARVVLFGGRELVTTNLLSDTWLWDGAQWTQSAASGPSPRELAAMAFDVGHQRMVLFGGTGAGALGDTWEWDGTAWLLRTTFGALPRWGHAMSYDAGVGRILMFGGTGGAGPTNDIWEWDGAAWSQWQPPTSPAARYATAMVFDSARSRTVLFCGYPVPQGSDTWELQGAGSPTIASQPQPTSVYPGQRAMFAAAASAPGGGGAVTYQWRRGGFNLTDGLRVSGSQTPVLTIENVTSTDAANYDLVVSNACGQTASAPVGLTLLCYANCDGSVTPPALNVIDFSCFLNRFAAGCP